MGGRRLSSAEYKAEAYIEHPNELEEEKENFYKMATDENGFCFLKRTS